MSGFQTAISISTAMKHISRNEYLLPAFQRDFVWKSEQIEKLFDSLMQGYPISSMLFWKVKGDTKARWKFYQFINSFVLNANDYAVSNTFLDANECGEFYAILDGQQRLTALRIGLYGQYAYHEPRKPWKYAAAYFPWRRLYLCLSKMGKNDDDYKYIFKFLKNSDTKEKDFYIDDDGELWFKVGAVVAIYDSNEETTDYYSDKEEYKNIKLNKDQKIIINTLKKVIFSDKAINFYEEDEQNPDKAVNIFTRINAGGTFLSFSDLVFSLMVSHWERKDARTEVRSLISSVAGMGFDINKDYIVKSFLYLYHRSVKTSIQSFDKEFCAKIENNWDEISAAIISLYDLLRSYGLTSYSLTSNNATLPILYYIYHKKIYDGFSTKKNYEQDRAAIKKWIMSAILRRIFGGQSDNILQQSRKYFTSDVDKEFISNDIIFDGRKLNENINISNYIDDDFIDSIINTQKDDRYAFSILSLLYPDLDYKNNNFHKDHLHPESAYPSLSKELREKYPFKLYNSILNLQMLDSNENQSKKDMPLDAWVNKQCDNNSNRKKFLDEHLIPDINLSLDNFDQYAKERYVILKDKLKEILI